jgi:MFS superfamily sulfate permease-like transporter
MDQSSSPRSRWSPHGWNDLVAGLLVSLVALPLCLGIAVASGFPPVAGVVTAIVGGLVATPFGSAPVTIKGPAAGLIVIVLGSVHDLGGGDAMLGYRATLAVGVVAALIQIVLAAARAGTLADMFPSSVLQGMLAAIGILLLSRQVHVLLGVAPTSRTPLALLAEIPHSIAQANVPVVVVALASAAALLLWPRLGWRFVPAPVVVVVVAIPLGAFFGFDRIRDFEFAGLSWSVGPQLLVQLPDDLGAAIVTPDFSRILSSTSLKYVVMLAFVGTVESLLSARAVDKLDPWRRQPDLSRDLFSVGVGNLVSAGLGGLPMISEIVRSSTNAAAGGRTGWANAFHGAFLLGFVTLLPSVIHHVPLAALATLLVHTALRLASPGVFREARKIGPEHLTVVLTTLMATLAVDLLVGIAAGLIVNAVLCLRSGSSLRALLRPRFDVETNDDAAVVRVREAAVFTGFPALRRAIHATGASSVTVDLSRARLVDHTTLERLHELAAQLDTRGTRLTIAGLDDHTPTSSHPWAARQRR